MYYVIIIVSIVTFTYNHTLVKVSGFLVVVALILGPLRFEGFLWTLSKELSVCDLSFGFDLGGT